MEPVEFPNLARCLFDESNDALFIFRPDDNSLVEANLTALQMTGFSRTELLERRLPDLFSAEDADDIGRKLRALQSTGQCRSGDKFVFLRRDQQPLPVHVSVSRIDSGPKPMSLAIVHDISRRRQAELELERLNDRLNQEVQLRPEGEEGTATTSRVSRQLLESKQRYGELFATMTTSDDREDVVLPQNSRRMAVVAMSVGAATVVLSFLVGFLAYRYSRSAEEIPPGEENTAKYRRRTSSWSEYVLLETGRIAVDAQFPIQIAEARKTAWQENNALKIDGDATFDRVFCQRDGVLRFHFPYASYAVATFHIGDDGKLIAEGIVASPALFLQTLINTSGDDLKLTNLSTGNTVRLKPNAKGEWEFADDAPTVPES
jgi:PAS domain S-box-containing protein